MTGAPVLTQESSPAPAARPRRLRPLLDRFFGLDLRSLALFRVGLGAVVLCDLANRLGDLSAFYTDAGVLTLAEVPAPWTASVHLLGGSYALQLALFALNVLFAAALLVGYRTPLAALGTWFLMASMQARNPVVLHGGDMTIRLMLFWAVFLPTGARFSLDAARKDVAVQPTRALSLGTAALTLQVCFIYWFAAALKTDPVWWRDGTAVYYALSLDQFNTPLGRYLLNYPDLLKAATFASYWLEAVGPIFLFCPFWTGPVRLAVVLGFIGFHLLGLGLCLELGLFSWICATAWAALLPTWAWEKAARWLGRPAEVPPAGEPPARVGRLSGIEKGLVAGLVVYVFLWNLRTVDRDRFGPALPASLDWVGSTFRVDQTWNMFAPFPSKTDGWVVVRGFLSDGTQVDPWTGRLVRWDKPADVAASYRNAQWRRYLMNLSSDDYKGYRPGFARYVWRQWDAVHRDGPYLVRLETWFVLEETLPEGKTAPPKAFLLHTQDKPPG